MKPLNALNFMNADSFTGTFTVVMQNTSLDLSHKPLPYECSITVT